MANAIWFTGPSEFFSQIRHRNALTEIAWGDTVQGLGMAISTVASEKNRKLLFIIYACCFTSISRARPPDSCKYQSPAKSQIFSMEKLVLRESGGNLVLGHLKARRLGAYRVKVTRK